MRMTMLELQRVLGTGGWLYPVNEAECLYSWGKPESGGSHVTLQVYLLGFRV